MLPSLLVTTMTTASPITATFAAVGDVHGAMHAMERLLDAWELEQRRRIDFVLQVGDFEPHRNQSDLDSASIPKKYRSVGDFPDFHEERAAFRRPVYFIGGNHEPYGHLETIPKGGQVAPNCHYLGRVGQKRISGISVAWLGGIYSDRGLAGRPPLSALPTAKKKLYAYFSQAEAERAMHFSKTDVLILHEWPRGAIRPEQAHEVANRRRARDAEAVGNELAKSIVDRLRPKLIIAGHMHWRHRSHIGLSRFAAMGHIDTGPDALGVFEARQSGDIVELAGLTAQRQGHGLGRTLRP